MQMLKEEYARKRIHNGCSVRIEKSVTWDNCSASLGKLRDAEQLPSWQNFQSAPHNLWFSQGMEILILHMLYYPPYFTQASWS